jgi:hypothetical protein
VDSIYRAFRAAGPILDTLIGVLLLMPDVLNKQVPLGEATVSLRTVVAVGYIVKGIIQLAEKLTGEESHERETKGKQLNAHIRAVIAYLDKNLGDDYRGKIRANIMVRAGENLKCLVYSAGHPAVEVEAEWPIGTGAWGVAYSGNEDIFCNLGPVNEAKAFDDLKDETGRVKYGLTPNLWGRTKHIKWVMCFVLRDEDRHPWGVLCISSTKRSISKRARSRIERFISIYRSAVDICFCT